MKPKRLKLDWAGPFAYGPRGIELNKNNPHSSEKELKNRLGQPGLYLVVGDHPIHGSRTLLYIGQASKLQRRLHEHYNWIADEWRVEIYLTVIKNKGNRNDCECLLIHAHSPPYNSKSISGIDILSPIQIWNDGRFWGLYPEISSDHPWYENAAKRNKEINR